MQTAPDPTRALRHPLWWSALLVLVLNDHVLKGAALLPGVVTGKLSDLAGLIVAPALAAALLRARTPRARIVAFALPVAPFVAINVSPAAAAVVERTMEWVVWTDPTDLVALAVLPVTWWLVSGAESRAVRRILVERAGLMLGGVACIATSAPPGEAFFTTNAFVVNRADTAIDVRLRWVDADVSCDAIASDPARALSPDVFGAGVTVTLEPDQVMPLERGSASRAVGAAIDDETTTTPATRECDAVLVQVDGLPSTVAFWGDLPQRNVSTPLEPGSDLVGQVTIEPDGERLRAEGNGVVVQEVVERTEPSACLGADSLGFDWSVADLPGLGSYVIDTIDHGPDGCAALTLSDALDATPYLIFVCAPESAMPFVPGDVLHVSTGGGSISLAREHADGSFGDELVLVEFQEQLVHGSIYGQLRTSDACRGARTACDAFVQPAVLEIDGEALAPGEAIDLGEDGAGRTVRVVFGRGEEVAVAHEGCEVERTAVGYRGDALVIYEEATE